MVAYVKYEIRKNAPPKVVVVSESREVPGTETQALTEVEERDLLLGEWFVRSAFDPGYTMIWEFFPEGTVVEKHVSPPGEVRTRGRWKFEPGFVRIIWDRKQDNWPHDNMWDNFNRPLKPHVRGDNWVAHDCVIADKIATVQRAQ